VPVLSAGDRCSLRSLAADESLAGTASTIRRWLLIEHPGPWGRDGLLDARLPQGLGSALRGLERRAGARVLLMRRPQGMSSGEVLCVAVDTQDAWLGLVRVPRIQDALDLDPRERARFETDAEPLVCVCTHGRRDPCCAERGRPLSQALAAAFPRLAWESTHIGGDRFAGNLVGFPHGLYFGRVAPDEGIEIVGAYTEGRIARLDRYRGRSSHPFHVQSAEAVLRRRLGLDRIDDATPMEDRRNGDHATVTFATPAGRHAVRLERTFGAPMRLTCHSEHREPPPVWRAIAIEPAGL
jgi:hypothetical protein